MFSGKDHVEGTRSVGSDVKSVEFDISSFVELDVSRSMSLDMKSLDTWGDNHPDIVSHTGISTVKSSWGA